MGQTLSQAASDGQVVDIKRQAPAANLLESALWFYNPATGRNLWGNRAALQLYNCSLDDFRTHQQQAWQAQAGQTAADAWQASNDQLLAVLKDLQPPFPPAKYVQLVCSGSYPNSSCSSGAEHAGFLPLPQGCLCLSAHAAPCVVLHKGKVMPALMVQVLSVQLAGRASPLVPCCNGVNARSASAEPGAAAETDRFEFEPVMAVAALSLHHQQQKQQDMGGGGGAADLPSSGWKLQLQHHELPVARSQSSTLPLRRVSRSAGGFPTTAISLDAAARAHSFNVVRGPPAASSSRKALHAGAAGLQPHSTSASGLSYRNRSSFESAMSTESGGSSVLAAARSGSLSTAMQHLKPQEQQQRRLRMTEMCDNHAMFQFLFDPQGVLLTANKRALNNMREHLGEQPSYTLAQYLAIGQFDGGLTADEIFQVIHTAIFINQEPSFRLPQLRWSKRRPGKCRWVLYEMWAMEDPVSGKPALLVTEQNITQVKAVEEEYSSQMRQLEAQLEEALLQQQQQQEEAAQHLQQATAAAAAAATAAAQQTHGKRLPLPAIDTSSAAEKVLLLLDKLSQGAHVSLGEVDGLRAALVQSTTTNLHAPLYLDEQVMHHTQALSYEPEVGASLLQMLSVCQWERLSDDSGSVEDKTLQEVEEADESDSSSGATTVQSRPAAAAAAAAAGPTLPAPAATAAAAAAAAASPMEAPLKMGTSSSIAGSACAASQPNDSSLTVQGSSTTSAGGRQGLAWHAAQPSPQQLLLRQPSIQHSGRVALPSAYPTVTASCAGPVAAAAAAGGSDEAACGGESCPAGGNAAMSAADIAAGSKFAAAGGTASAGMSAGAAGGAVEGVKKRNAAVRQMMTLANSPTLELEAVLAKADDWQFDTFKLAAASDNRPLSVLAFYLLKRSGLVARMSLNEGRLACWLVRVEDGYQANPYHNRTHAADVLRNVHVIMCRGGLAAAGLGDDLTVLGTYLAAVVHDFEHRGVNNDFLVRSGDGLALLYNDRSPHENHHLAASWGLLIEHNLLRALSHKQKELLRRLMIELVLATDMKQHFAIHGLFQAKLHIKATITSQRSSGGIHTAGNSGLLPQLNTVSSAQPRDTKEDLPAAEATGGSSSQQHQQTPPASSRARSITFDGQFALAASGNGGNSTASPTAAAPAGNNAAEGGSFVLKLRRTSSLTRRAGAPGGSAVAAAGSGAAADALGTWEDDHDNRSLHLQMCLKAADLGHLAAPRAVHRQWVAALEEENFRQGDRERAAGLTVSPLMDRGRGGITKSQVGFFDIVALPLYKSLAQRFSNLCPLLEAVLDNYGMWVDQEKDQSSSCGS